MKKVKKYLFPILILILVFCPIISGCGLLDTDLSCFGGDTGGDLVIYENSQAMSWKEVSGALGYDIYLDGEKVDSVDEGINIYKFSWLLDEAKTYDFKVKSVSSGVGVSKSTTYSGSYTLSTAVVDKVDAGVVEEKEEYYVDAYISDSRIYFDVPSVSCNFALGLESNSLGYKEYYFEPNTTSTHSTQEYYIDLSDFTSIPKTEISAMRILAIIDNQKYAISDVFYFNPDNFSGYTDDDKIYIFDGKIYDYYINTLDELQTLMYRSFIYREKTSDGVIADLDIRLSEEVYNLANACSGLRFIDRLDELVYNYGLNSFIETIVFQTGNKVGTEKHFAREISSKNRTYNIKIDYLVGECDTNIVATNTKTQESSLGYYDVVKDDYTMLSVDIENGYEFASDHRFLSTEVDTSEELYWAVENGVTPIVEKNSSAEEIYNKAKTVLGEIVSNEMTDFEKVLSIFDWICINTVYDYSEYTEYDSDGNYVSGKYPPECPCYYLEGVFINGTAVCDGFSKAFSLMCNMLDIDAVRVVGTASSGGSIGGHAWNKVLLDDDPDDDIPAKYYLVDITWTEISGNSTEVLAHTYFLVDDEMVEETHFPYEYRDKFKFMPANECYDYYNSRVFEYANSEYDFVVDSDGDALALFYYMLYENIDYLEVMFDYDYMVQVYNTENNTTYNVVSDSGFQRLLNTFVEYLRGQKFQEQYLTLQYATSFMVYNNSGSIGVICILSQNLLIDADGEVEHLVNSFNSLHICGTFNLYVYNSILLNGVIGGNALDLVKAVFEPYLEGKNIQIEFSIEEGNANLLIDGNKCCLFQIVVSEK